MRPCDISEMLGQMEADDLNEFDRKTRECVRGVEQTGNKGTITLTIDFKKNGQNSVMFNAQVKAKVPTKPAGGRVMFFALDDKELATGQLSVLPHKQVPMFTSDNITPIKKGN